MPRYLVERSFDEGTHVPLIDEGVGRRRAVVAGNADLGATWVHSYATEDQG